MTLLEFTLALIVGLVADAPEQQSLALAVATAAEERPLFPGDDGRATAALLVSIAYWESGHSFDCSRVGDGGHSVSCFQIWACGPGFDPQVCATLRTNVFEAARVARDALGQSLRECRRLPAPERISKYTTGKCVRNKESRIRWATAQRLLRGQR